MAILTFDLIPKPLWRKTSVRHQLEPAAWLDIVDKTAEKANYKCEICGGLLAVCHSTFSSIYLGDNQACYRLAGFEAICRLCDNIKHIGRTKRFYPDQYEDSLNHYGRINNLARPKIMSLLQVAISVHASVNTRVWTVDFSYLRELGYNLTSEPETCTV